MYALYDAFKQTSNGHLADLLQIAVQDLELAENLTDPTSKYCACMRFCSICQRYFKQFQDLS